MLGNLGWFCHCFGGEGWDKQTCKITNQKLSFLGWCALCLFFAIFSPLTSLSEQEISELLQRSLPQLNFGVAESLTLLSETPNSYGLDDTLRSHQYSLLLLFYFAFSQEDR